MQLLISKKAIWLVTTIPITVSHLSLIDGVARKKEIFWMSSLTYQARLKKDLLSKFRLGPKIQISRCRHDPESAAKFLADPRSTVSSESANPLNLPQKSISTIRALFKAKSVDPKTYSPPP